MTAYLTEKMRTCYSILARKRSPHWVTDAIESAGFGAGFGEVADQVES